MSNDHQRSSILRVCDEKVSFFDKFRACYRALEVEVEKVGTVARHIKFGGVATDYFKAELEILSNLGDFQDEVLELQKQIYQTKDQTSDIEMLADEMEALFCSVDEHDKRLTRENFAYVAYEPSEEEKAQLQTVMDYLSNTSDEEEGEENINDQEIFNTPLVSNKHPVARHATYSRLPSLHSDFSTPITRSMFTPKQTITNYTTPNLRSGDTDLVQLKTPISYTSRKVISGSQKKEEDNNKTAMIRNLPEFRMIEEIYAKINRWTTTK